MKYNLAKIPLSPEMTLIISGSAKEMPQTKREGATKQLMYRKY